MSKNGELFISVIHADRFVPSVWDPYAYRQNGNRQTLSDFAEIRTITRKNQAALSLRSPFRPVEYKDIHHGNYLSFTLEPNTEVSPKNLPVVGEQTLLIGTMRAYLGNILVTPKAEWVDQESPVYFRMKSEFAVMEPHDRLSYFWLLYLRSEDFLRTLPPGTGGTRPRIQPEGIGTTPVAVPALKKRQDLHQQLKALAQDEWRHCTQIGMTVNSQLEGGS